jgi:hypothetical protein
LSISTTPAIYFKNLSCLYAVLRIPDPDSRSRKAKKATTKRGRNEETYVLKRRMFSLKCLRILLELESSS